MKNGLPSKKTKSDKFYFSDSPLLVGVIQIISLSITMIGVMAITSVFYYSTFAEHKVLGVTTDNEPSVRQKVEEQIKRLTQIKNESSSVLVELELDRLNKIVE